MSRQASLTEQDVARIITQLTSAGWDCKQVAVNSFWCYPKNGKPPVNVARTRSGAFITYRELRRRGIEADPRRMRRVLNQRESIEELDELDLPPIPYEEQRSQKPLPEGEPSEWARSLSLSDHTISRLNERNIGVFEMYAALDHPDYSARGKGHRHNQRVYVRGDIEVVIDPDRNRVITVIDLHGVHRTEPRVVLTPVSTTPQPSPSTPEETMPQAFQPNLALSRGAQIRAYLATLSRGSTFTVAQLRRIFPHIQPQTISTSIYEVKNRGFIEFDDSGAQGAYVCVNPEAIGAMMTFAIRKPAKAKPIEATASTPTARLERAREVNSGLAPSSASSVAEFLETLKPGDDFSGPTLVDLLADKHSRSAIGAQLRHLVEEGVLAARTQAGTRVYTVLGDTPADADSCPVYVDDEEDVMPVNMGFSFEAPPPSDIYDLATVLKQNMSEMADHPGSWARIATYETGNSSIVEKKASRLEEYLDNSNVQFSVRKVSETQIGLFARFIKALGLR